MTDIYSYGKKPEKQTMIETDTGKRKKEKYIENLREGDVVDDLFAVASKLPLRTYKRGSWFGLKVSDKTGEINVKYWGGDNKDRVKRLHESFRAGDVIQIRHGNVEIYEEKPQISINETSGGLRRCATSEYDVTDFIPALDDDKIEELLSVIKDEIEEIGNEDIKSLMKAFFDDPDISKEFSHSPSAMTHHHNYVGGNLEHTVGVLRLCKNICEMYSGIDKDLVIAGAILHDIGKLKEYKMTASIEKTSLGNFIGHIVMGEQWIQEKISEIRKKKGSFDSNIETFICHIILSHHGKYEFGSPRMPKIIEACVIHQADLMDSQVKNFMQNIEEARKSNNEDWTFVWDSDIGRKRVMYSGEI